MSIVELDVISDTEVKWIDFTFFSARGSIITGKWPLSDIIIAAGGAVLVEKASSKLLVFHAQ
ncbi:hypothetical protein KY289_018382 [Solanum tuberosum]|nr:hypothetical protein KY289_018382 [Solanum tuberosum]